MGFTITYNAKYILDIFNIIAGVWNGLVQVNYFFTQPAHWLITIFVVDSSVLSTGLSVAIIIAKYVNECN